MTKEEIQKRIEREEIEMADAKVKKLIYDIFFKAVFMKEEDILLNMIKTILDIKEKNDTTITIDGFELPPNYQDSNLNESDILIKLSDDTYVNIEMNKQDENNILARNAIQISRIYDNFLKKDNADNEYNKIKTIQANLNIIAEYKDRPKEYNILCEKKNGIVVRNILDYCNIDIVKCHEIIYNKSIKDISKEERWGALLYATSIKEISYIIGDDLLTAEEKKRFLKRIVAVNKDNKILQDWMIEENAKMKLKGQMRYEYNKGVKEGIKEGIKKGIETKEIEVINNMLNEKSSYEFISKITGKTIEEIKEIESNN